MSRISASGWVEPCKAVLVKEPPACSDWIHEIKHDGYRVIAVISAGRARIFTRRGLDWSSRMPSIRAVLEVPPVTSATIDGEAIMVGQDGFSDFFALHKALAAGSAPDAGLIAFHLIELDGKNLRDDAIEARRKRLIGSPTPALQFSDEIGGEGKDALRAACEMGLEGIVSKRRGAAYRSGRNPEWRKVKCSVTDFFAIIDARPARGSVRFASGGAPAAQWNPDALRLGRLRPDGSRRDQASRGNTPSGAARLAGDVEAYEAVR
jgi:bifunctional non-homologous end joining protein LigD